MRTRIFVTTRFEGIHCWPDAPDEVAFLRSPHRHEFHVRLEIEVYHAEREVEFIIEKRALDAWLRSADFDTSASCETMACAIFEWARSRHPVERCIKVEVSEDGENGAIVCCG